MKTRASAVVIAAAVVGTVLGIGWDRTIGAQQEAIKRTVVLE
jgi:hypothetical protein